jgi:chromosome segregation ATPase
MDFLPTLLGAAVGLLSAWATTWRYLNSRAKQADALQAQRQADLEVRIKALEESGQQKDVEIERLVQRQDRLKETLDRRDDELRRLRADLAQAREEAARIEGQYQTMAMVVEHFFGSLKIEVKPVESTISPQ